MNPDILKKAFSYFMNQALVLYFRLDKDGTILDTNKFASELLGHRDGHIQLQDLIVDFEGTFYPEKMIKDEGKSYLLSITDGSESPTSYYFSFFSARDDILVFAQKDIAEMEFMRKQVMSLNQDMGNITRQLHKKNAQLQNALDHVKTLQGIIPICAHCHKIRNDDQIWDDIENYLSEHTDARLSHGICPDCLKDNYAEFLDDTTD